MKTLYSILVFWFTLSGCVPAFANSNPGSFINLRANLKCSPSNSSSKNLNEIRQQIIQTRQANSTNAKDLKCLLTNYLDEYVKESDSLCQTFKENFINEESPEKLRSKIFPLKDRFDSKWRENFFSPSKPLLNFPLSSIKDNPLNNQSKNNPEKVAIRALFCSNKISKKTASLDSSQSTPKLFFDLIEKGIDFKRNRILKEIVSKLENSSGNYTLEEVDRNIAEYHQSCSIQEGLFEAKKHLEVSLKSLARAHSEECKEEDTKWSDEMETCMGFKQKKCP